MSRGYRLTQRERDFIDAHPELFASQIAARLSEMYPEDNHGSLKPGCINRYLAGKPTSTPKYSTKNHLLLIKKMSSSS